MWKSAKVILLTTDNNSGLLLGLSKTGKLISYNTEYTNPSNHVYYAKKHFYILSEDEIKKEDWFHNKMLNIIAQADSFTDLDYVNKSNLVKKIIAKTDKSLDKKLEALSAYESKYVGVSLPQIPQQFIEQYITEYNKGNIIVDILVEYGEYNDTNTNKPNGRYYLKINQDNTINIKTVKIKDSFSREEVIQLINKFETDTYPDRFEGYGTEQENIDNWIEQNL